jgi:hypothetical protein
MQKWSDCTFFGENDSLSDAILISAGGEFIPDYTDAEHYLKRVHYRIGGFYSKTYLNLKGVQLNGAALTVGLGLPVFRSSSILNIAAEFGTRGTLENQLIRETYSFVTVALCFKDWWFRKRKIE